MNSDIDFLGELLVRKFHNTAVICAQGLCEDRFDSPGHREYQRLLRSLSVEQKELLQKVVRYCVEGALNDTLYSLDTELNKKNPRLTISIDDESLSNDKISSMLHSRLWGTEGWLRRYGG